MLDISSWKVLIVDDEPDNVEVVKLVMEFHDVAVLVATSARECLDLLEQERPTLLLIDIQMPDVSGVELLQRIRADEDWRAIPAVAVTAYSMQGDRERLLNAGFDGYVGKPISALTLMDDLLTILNKRADS